MKSLAAALFCTILALPAFAATAFDSLVDGVIKTYGGAAAWKNVKSITEHGTISSAMAGHGVMTRVWSRDRRLRVEIVYPDHTEVRALAGGSGTHNGKPVAGPPLDAMTLQWARLAIPALLIDYRAHLHDLGTREGLRLIEIPLSNTLTVIVAVDPKTFHIVRSAGKGTGGGQTIEFATEYSDLRKTSGLLIAYGEENFAQGMKTGDTTIRDVQIER